MYIVLWKKSSRLLINNVSVVAEVSDPVTVRVPLGCTLEEVVTQAERHCSKGSCLFRRQSYDGIRWKWFRSGDKDNKCDFGSAKDHLIAKKRRTSSIDLKGTLSICCRCNTCADLSLSRRNLGHPSRSGRKFEPHQIMISGTNPYLDVLSAVPACM